MAVQANMATLAPSLDWALEMHSAPMNSPTRCSGTDCGDSEPDRTGVIGLLEVCESDFSNVFAELIQTETTAVRDDDAQTKEGDITRVTKEQDVKQNACPCNTDESSEHPSLPPEHYPHRFCRNLT